jgi:hypothetical protein
MITIHNLEVNFEVEGDDKQRFALLFKEYIRQWTAEAENQKAREMRLARERSLGDRPPEGAMS